MKAKNALLMSLEHDNPQTRADNHLDEVCAEITTAAKKGQRVAYVSHESIHLEHDSDTWFAVQSRLLEDGYTLLDVSCGSRRYVQIIW